MSTHADHILSVVNQRLFLLNLLRKHGLSVDKAREIVFPTLIISRLTPFLLLLASCLVCTSRVLMPIFRKSVK
jgi:hypothetical protein